MPIRVLLLLSTFCLLFSSCSPSTHPPTYTPTSLILPTLDTSSLATATLVAIPLTETLTPVPSLPRPKYTFFVTLDYHRKRLSVEQNIVYTNATGETLRDLVLAVMPNIWETVFKLTKLQVDGKTVTDYKLDGQRLTIHLPALLKPEATVELSLAYNIILPEIDPELSTTEIRPQFFGYTDRQMNLVNWYPFIVPREAGKWLLHDAWYFGEHLVYDTADFDVNIKNAEKGVVPVIAASGPAEPNGEYTRTEFKRTVTNAGNVFIYSYYFSLYEPSGEAAAQAAAQAIGIYTERFGPYPHKTLTIAMSDFNDGAEFSAFFFLSKEFYKRYDNTRANYLTFISAHETAHQWWFEQVANDQYLEPWLDEALCAYSERLFYEQTDWPLVQWWWDYRINAYTPKGFVDIPLNTPFEGEMYRQYINAVYFRGAEFLEALRIRIGDEAFFAFLQDYLNQFKDKRATADDFFIVLREHTDADISDLTNEYFQNSH
jgi:hypothetical protein